MVYQHISKHNKHDSLHIIFTSSPLQFRSHPSTSLKILQPRLPPSIPWTCFSLYLTWLITTLAILPVCGHLCRFLFLTPLKSLCAQSSTLGPLTSPLNSTPEWSYCPYIIEITSESPSTTHLPLLVLKSLACCQTALPRLFSVVVNASPSFIPLFFILMSIQSLQHVKVQISKMFMSLLPLSLGPHPFVHELLK